MNNVQQVKTYSQRKISDFLFILWAGGAALLSYSLVYALRKPYTAAGFDGLEAVWNGLQSGSYHRANIRICTF